MTPYPLDVLGAESEGMIGYLLDQELVNALGGRPVATLLTQVIVDADDPAFADPTKFIGPVYDRATAGRMAAERGWQVRADGAHWRRVVASPAPRSIVELPTVRLLIESGVLVVCVGGGGIPVVVDREGRLRGVEAVIDKDRAAALLAHGLDADALLLLTDVVAVERDHGTAQAAPIARATADELLALGLPAGLDGPQGRGRRVVRAGHRRPCRDRQPRRGGRGARRSQRDDDRPVRPRSRRARSGRVTARRRTSRPRRPSVRGRGDRASCGSRTDPG